MSYEGRYAYAVGVIDHSTPIPTVIGVGIYSSNAGEVTLTTRTRFPFDIAEGRGKTYSEAEANVREILAQPVYAWALKLLEER